MKRGLFVFPNSKFWVEAIKKLIKAGYYPEVIVGDDFHKKYFKNSLIYDTSLFKLANYPSFLNVSNKLDKKTYYELSESILSSNICLSRFLPSKNDASTDDRDIFINKSINVIFSLFSKFKFDFIILASPPHRVIDQLLIDIGKLKKIPTLFFHHTMLDQYHFISSEPYIQVKDNNDKTKKPSDFILSVVEKISKGESFKSSLSFNSPNFLYKVNKETVFKRFLKKLIFLKKKNLMYEISKIKIHEDIKFTNYIKFKLSSYFTSFKVKLAEHYYNKISKPLNLKEKYLYFPLTYQPEQSNCPSGGYFSHNLLSFFYLINLIPDNYTIYCKIHPRQFQKPISRDNYFDLAYIKSLSTYSPRIKFLHSNTNNLEIIKNCSAVITDGNASSSFLEAMCFSKKVLSLSKDAYFRFFDNVLDLRSEMLNKNILDMFLRSPFDKNKFYKNLYNFEKKTFDFSSYLISQHETRQRINFDIGDFDKKFSAANDVFVKQIIKNIN